MVKSPIVFISGGVRSGKSQFAEEYAYKMSKYLKKDVLYLATAVSFDKEMTTRINRHKKDREERRWRTIEQPTELADLMPKIHQQEIVLWDCVTTWLTNELYALELHDKKFVSELSQPFIAMIERTKELIQQLHAKGVPLIIVSNEVLDEPLAKSKEVLFYQEQLGLFHQWLVKVSTDAIEMDYTIARYWKKAGEEK